MAVNFRFQDFPEGVANSAGACANLLFHKIFDKNCMKMKEFGLRGVPSAPLDAVLN